MQKYQSIITATNGSVIRNVPVTVLKEDGSLAEIFLDREGQVPASNPLATDSRGVFYFYAVNGRYSLRTSVDGITITDADAVLLNDPEELATAGPIADAVLRAETAAQRAEVAVEASGIPELVAAAQNAVVDANNAVGQAQAAASLADTAKNESAAAKVAAENAQSGAQSAYAQAGQARADAQTAAQAAAQSAASIDPAYLRNRANHTGTQAISTVTDLQTALNSKVDKVAGKQLSTEDYTSAEKAKLSGIATGATANAPDANLRDRATHTGTQAPDTIAGLTEWQANPTGVQSINGGQLAGMRNKIINGAFQVNQRVYVSGATTTAGQYTLDRWKVTSTAGVSFSATANKTTVSIPAGQTLQQVIEGLNLQTGTYVLSWEGTAQGRIGTGQYGVSGAVTAAITGGENTTIEFGAGTVANVQLEPGTVATPFEHQPRGVELFLCQRYYQELGVAGGSDLLYQFYQPSSYTTYLPIVFPVEMRASPTGSVAGVWSGVPFTLSTSRKGVRLSMQGNAGSNAVQNSGANSRLTFNAEL